MEEQMVLDFKTERDQKCKTCYWMHNGDCLVKKSADGKCGQDVYRSVTNVK